MLCYYIAAVNTQPSRKGAAPWEEVRRPFCGGEGEIKMNLFTSYEEENIHYWTHRASGYSGVNQEELATAQKHIWGAALYELSLIHI